VHRLRKERALPGHQRAPQETACNSTTAPCIILRLRPLNRAPQVALGPLRRLHRATVWWTSRGRHAPHWNTIIQYEFPSLLSAVLQGVPIPAMPSPSPLLDNLLPSSAEPAIISVASRHCSVPRVRWALYAGCCGWGCCGCPANMRPQVSK
jgi:hypothetical protein